MRSREWRRWRRLQEKAREPWWAQSASLLQRIFNHKGLILHVPEDGQRNPYWGWPKFGARRTLRDGTTYRVERTGWRRV